MQYGFRPVLYEVFRKSNPNEKIGRIILDDGIWRWELDYDRGGIKGGYKTSEDAYEGLVDYLTNSLHDT